MFPSDTTWYFSLCSNLLAYLLLVVPAASTIWYFTLNPSQLAGECVRFSGGNPPPVPERWRVDVKHVAQQVVA